MKRKVNIMATDVAVAIIEILPSILLTGAVLILILVFRKPLEQRILPNLSSVKLFGFEITLLKQSLDQVSSGGKVPVSEDDKWSALKRAKHVQPVLQGARILWVDDEPGQNFELVKILLSLGTSVDQATSTKEALEKLRKNEYHVVISDIKRGAGDNNGLAMVSKMVEEKLYRWTIFYVLNLKPGVPEYAFNITNRPDHLLHFIMDILERERWSN